MKKMVMILLCLFMFTACGGNDYEELTTMLDEGKYTEAVEYINQLAYEAAKNNGSVDTKDTFMKYLLGSWEYSGGSSDITTYDIEMKDNKTCTIDGTKYLWEIDTEYETGIAIDILEGASKAFRFDLSYNKDTQFYSGYLSKYNLDDDSYTNLGDYRNNAHYDIIELTTDNWSDYFELNSYIKFHKDAFGDTSYGSYTAYYKLKDEYFNRLNTSSNYSKIAYEYEYDHGKMYLDYDITEEKLELGEFEISDSRPTDTTSGKMDRYSLNTDESFYGFNVINGATPTESSGKYVFYNFRQNPTMLRIEGKLMLWKGLE